MNELESAIFSLPACAELLRFPVAEAAEMMIAAATSATAIGAIHRRMFMDSQLLSVRAHRRSASWIVVRERFSRRQRRLSGQNSKAMPLRFDCRLAPIRNP